MTPRELQECFRANEWEERQNISLAWLVANLVRAQEVPSLAQVLGRGETQPLSAEEKKRRTEDLGRRKAEHEEMIQRMLKRG